MLFSDGSSSYLCIPHSPISFNLFSHISEDHQDVKVVLDMNHLPCCEYWFPYLCLKRPSKNSRKSKTHTHTQKKQQSLLFYCLMYSQDLEDYLVHGRFSVVVVQWVNRMSTWINYFLPCPSSSYTYLCSWVVQKEEISCTMAVRQE